MAKRTWLGVEVPESADRPRERRRVWEQLHGEDQAEVVYEFDDGWTVRNITRFIDAVREGYLVGHCLDGRDRPWGLTSEDFIAERLCHEEAFLMSLRDPRNHPRCTFFLIVAHGQGVAIEPHSIGFGPGLDPRYAQRIAEFEQADLPELEEPQEIFNTVMGSPDCSYRAEPELLGMTPIAPALWIT
jgi:hypothetical protein